MADNDTKEKIRQNVLFYINLLKRPQEKNYQLADRIGVKPSSLSEWKKGVKYPDVKSLHRISAGLGIPIEYLYEGPPPPIIKK